MNDAVRRLRKFTRQEWTGEVMAERSPGRGSRAS